MKILVEVATDRDYLRPALTYHYLVPDPDAAMLREASRHRDPFEPEFQDGARAKERKEWFIKTVAADIAHALTEALAQEALDIAEGRR